jgi:hypothetical protein
MTALYWIDIVALFAATGAFWAISSLLLRLALWLGRGNALLLGEFATVGIALMGITLLAFSVRFVDRPTRWPDIAALVRLAIIAAIAVPLFRHRVVFNPRLVTNGSTALSLSPLGIMLSPIPAVFLLWSLFLFWRDRKQIGERYFALSVCVLLLGLIAGGIFELPFPILSITNTISVALIGYGVISRQLFNPLREREARLLARSTDAGRKSGDRGDLHPDLSIPPLWRGGTAAADHDRRSGSGGSAEC